MCHRVYAPCREADQKEKATPTEGEAKGTKRKPQPYLKAEAPAEGQNRVS